MTSRRVPRWIAWLSQLLLAAMCVFIFRAWLGTTNVMLWLQVLSFCA